MKRTCMIVACMAIPLVAYGYHAQGEFDKPTIEGGSDGNWFTGSPRSKGLDCQSCHVFAQPRISLQVSSVPAGLFSQKTYQPGMKYDIVIKLLGEHRGLNSMFNPNSFNAEFLNDANAKVGEYTVDGPEYPKDDGKPVIAIRDDGQVLASRSIVAARDWRFGYTAPPAGTGRVTFYISLLDGDGAGLTNKAGTDVINDDSFTGLWRFCEEGVSCDAEQPLVTEEVSDSPIAHGCSVGGEAPLATLLVVLIFALRRRGRFAIVFGLVLAGCYDPILPMPDDCQNQVCQSQGDRDGGPTDVSPGHDTLKLPRPCDCPGCRNTADCEQDCPVHAGEFVCYFPAEGCWIRAEACP